MSAPAGSAAWPRLGRERVATELSARATETASACCGCDYERDAYSDAAAVVRHLQPFIDDDTVSEISVTDTALERLSSLGTGRVQTSERVLRAEATEPVRKLVETIPGAATPDTFGPVQAAGASGAAARGDAPLAHRRQACNRKTCWFLRRARLVGGLVASRIAWRAASRSSADCHAHQGRRANRQGDYTRPLEVRRRDVLGELQQALEHMRAGCGNRRSTKATSTAS